MLFPLSLSQQPTEAQGNVLAGPPRRILLHLRESSVCVQGSLWESVVIHNAQELPNDKISLVRLYI